MNIRSRQAGNCHSSLLSLLLLLLLRLHLILKIRGLAQHCFCCSNYLLILIFS